MYRNVILLIATVLLATSCRFFDLESKPQQGGF